jgi:hypothetical protein
MSVPGDHGPRRGPRRTGAAATRHAGSTVRWTPVAGLSPLARALLNDDLGGRETVPGHVADRVTAEAQVWAEHGFTAETVRPWTDLSPVAAAYLAERGVSPRVLELPVEVARSPAPIALKLAIASGLLTVERAYELLVVTGEHVARTTRPAGPPPASGHPSATGPAAAESAGPRRPVAQVFFSHATEE